MGTGIQDSLFWLLCTGAVLGTNAAFFRARAAVYAAGNPVMLKEADGILRAFAVYGCGLLALAAVGSALDSPAGAIRPIREPGSLTTFDVVYMLVYGSGQLGRATWWVFLEGGAELLAEHHEMFRFFPSSHTGVRVLWALAMSGLGVGMFEILRGAA